jgi:hypothetical protein
MRAPAEASRPKRPPDFIARLHRQRVTARVPGQPAIIGELVGYSQYELVIRTDRGKDVLVFKGAGLVLDLPDGWRQRRPQEAGPA